MMDEKLILERAYNKLLHQISYRHEKIALLSENGGSVYEQLDSISRHAELMISDIRRALTNCHNDLQAFGYCPQEIPIHGAPDVEVDIIGKTVRVLMDGMLPFPAKGSVYFLHEKLDAALRQYSRDNALPQPLFDERCAVVFIHRYAGKGVRQLRDYDNTERRCITNVIARHFLRDDSPACYMGVDILAPVRRNQTEIRVMTIPDFRAFIISEKNDFPL